MHVASIGVTSSMYVHVFRSQEQPPIFVCQPQVNKMTLSKHLLTVVTFRICCCLMLRCSILRCWQQGIKILEAQYMPDLCVVPSVFNAYSVYERVILLKLLSFEPDIYDLYGCKL